MAEEKKETAQTEVSSGKKSKGKKKVSFRKGLRTEFKKITWPDKTSLTRQSVAVVAVTLVLSVLIALLDVIFQYGVDWLIKM